MMKPAASASRTDITRGCSPRISIANAGVLVRKQTAGMTKTAAILIMIALSKVRLSSSRSLITGLVTIAVSTV